MCFLKLKINCPKNLFKSLNFLMPNLHINPAFIDNSPKLAHIDFSAISVLSGLPMIPISLKPLNDKNLAKLLLLHPVDFCR